MPLPAQPPPVVAVINTNDDLVDLLREFLIGEGFAAVTGHIRDFKSGREDFGGFLRSHAPRLVVYDVAIPYEDNWTFLQTLRKLPEAQGIPFLVTTVNKKVMDQRLGVSDVIEIQGGHADDLDPVVDAIREAVGLAPSTRHR